MKKARMTLEELRTLELPVTLECDNGWYKKTSLESILVIGIGDYTVFVRDKLKVEVLMPPQFLKHYPSQKPEPRTITRRGINYEVVVLDEVQDANTNIRG